MIENVICVKMKGWELLLFVLIISLAISCNSGQLKTGQSTVSKAKFNTQVKFSSGPKFPFSKQAACCKGVPSRAKILAVKVK